MSIKLLVIDDDPRILETLKRNLTCQGYIVLTAAEGALALQAYEREQPDITLVDLRMPAPDGLEILQTIRQQNPKAEVILITGYDNRDTILAALRAGASDVISKPIENEVLTAALEQAQERLRRTQELVAAQKALQQQRDTTQLYLDTAGVMIIVIDTEQTVRLVNKKGCELLGYTQAKIVGKNWFDHFLPDHIREESKNRFEELITSGIESIYHHSILSQDGREKIISWHNAVLLDNSGNATGVLSSGEDITERKAAEARVQRLLKQEAAANQLTLSIGDTQSLEETCHIIYEHVKEFMDAQAFIISFYDPTTNSLRAGYVVSGDVILDTADFPPIPLEEKDQGTQSRVIRSGQPFYTPDYRQAMETTQIEYTFTKEQTVTAGPPPPDRREDSTNSALYVPMKIGGKTIGVLQVQSHRLDAYTQEDSDLLVALANVAAIAIQSARLYEAAQEEIIERKRLEQQIEERRLYLESLLSCAPDAIITLDPHNRVVEWNPGAEHLFNYSRQEALGQDIDDLVTGPGGEQYEEANNYSQRAQSGEAIPPAEATRYRKDNTPVEVILAGSSIVVQGQVVGVIVVYTDISARKQSEMILQRQVEQLAALSQATQAVAASLELDQVLNHVVALAHQVANSDYTSIILTGEAGGINRSIEEIPGIPSIEYRIREQGLTDWILHTGQPIIINEINKAGAFKPRLGKGAPRSINQSVVQAGVQSVAGLPLVATDNLLGVLYLHSLRPGAFQDQLSLLTTFANQAAVAIQNAHLFQAQREQRELAEALQEAATVVSGTLDLDQVLDRILKQVERVVDGDAFNIMLIENDNIRIVRQRGYGGLIARGESAVKSEPITKYPLLVKMIETRESIVVPDTTQNPDWTSSPGQEWLRSYIGAPIQVSGLVVGFLNVDSTQPGQFGPDDGQRLEAFAHHAAIAVENARLYRGAARRLAQTQVLHEVMLVAASTLDFDQVLEWTLQKLSDAMNLELVCFAMPNEEQTGLRLHSSMIGFPPGADKILLLFDKSICGKVYQTGEPMIVSDVRQVPYYYEFISETRSEMAVPVHVGKQVIGVLNLESVFPDAFDQEDLIFYTAIAGGLGVTLANARLFEREQLQANELALAVEQLEELDRLKSEFIQNVSHELRQPLALIRGYAELLASGELGQLNEEQERPASIIVRRTKMLSQMVDDIILILLAESRTKEPELVSIAEMTDAAVQDFRLTAAQAGITLITETASDLPPVSGDPISLRRVLDNLIGNAIKFSPDGGTITVKVDQQGKELCLQVIDTGIGIPLEKQPHIFDRFYQVDGSSKRKFGGVGLGLALVKELAEAHGGTVVVKSKTGQGSTFIVTLPVSVH